MCDSARCPQATHHPCHRPVWADARRAAPRPSSAASAPTRKTERARLQADHDRALRVLDDIDAASRHADEPGETCGSPLTSASQNESRDPGRHGPAPARRHPARRQMRHQDPRPRGRRRPHRLLRHPPLRRTCAKNSSTGSRLSSRPASSPDPPRRPDRPAQGRDRHGSSNAWPTSRPHDHRTRPTSRHQALARLAAQHDEITRLRSDARQSAVVRRLPSPAPSAEEQHPS